ncbi:hypothetical protein IAT38_002562 [Cryptococcus sp. DSM 104549]
MEEERRTSRSLPDRLNSPDQGPFPSPTHSLGRQAAPPHPYIPPRDQRDQWREPHPRPHSAYAREPPSYHPASLSPYPHPNVAFPPPSPARPPSSSSDSGSASGAGSRFRAPKNERSSGPHLAPPPLAAYVTPDRRYFAPPPAQEQWLGPDGRRIPSQDRDRPAFPPVQRPPPDHVLAAASAAARHHPPPPLTMSFRPGSSSEGSSQASSPTRKIYSAPGAAGGSGMSSQGQGQTPTTMQFSRLTTADSRSPLTPPLPKREELPGPTGRYGYPGEFDRPPPGVRQQQLPPQGWYPPVPAVLSHASSSTAFPAGPSTSHTIHPRPSRPRAFSSSSAHSHRSHHSAQSAHSHQSRSEQMHRGHSVGSTSSRASSRMEGSVSSSTGTAHESGALGGDGGLGLQSMGRQPGGEKKKRTRALMTHTQQSGLTRLWKKTKFPTSNDREKLGLEIGLTPRQVQVWFQNQRQKGRKTLQVNGGVPEGEDPADYEDLQKSPRSRRLSMEQEDRVSAWAGSSSSSSSTGWHLGEFAAYDYGRERVGGHHPHSAGIGGPPGPAGQLLGPGGMPPSGGVPGAGEGMGYSPSPEYERWEYSKEYAGYQGHPSHHAPAHSLSMPQPHQQQPHQQQPHQQRFPQHSPRRPHTYPHPHAHPPPLPPISTAWDREREREYFPSVLQPPRSAGAISQGSVRSVRYSSPPAMGLPPLEASVPPPNWGPPGASSYRYGPAPPERPRPASSSGARRRSRSTEHMSHPPVHPPSLPSAPLVSSETAQRRPRSPSKSSIQSTRSMLSKSSSPPTTAGSMSGSARTSHLPPNLARIAIRGPVSGGQGEDLPGIDAGDADEGGWAGAGKGLGSPRKRLGEWEGDGRRVRGRGEGRGSLSEEEGEGRRAARAPGDQA